MSQQLLVSMPMTSNMVKSEKAMEVKPDGRKECNQEIKE
jgi:hypothetical protein